MEKYSWVGLNISCILQSYKTCFAQIKENSSKQRAFKQQNGKPEFQKLEMTYCERTAIFLITLAM
jgi:hypothetical protein